MSAPKAAKVAVEKMKQRVDGLGGIIIINKNGEYGFAHNTSKMAFAYVADNGHVVAKIKI